MKLRAPPDHSGGKVRTSTSERDPRFCGLRARAGDACVPRRTRPGVKRTLALATLCAAASLTACKEPQGDPGVGLVRGGQGVAMESVRVYAGKRTLQT